MNGLRRRTAAVMLGAMLALAWGCASTGRVAPAAGVAGPEPTTPASATPVDPTESLGFYREEYRRKPNNGELIAEYLRTIEDIKRSADLSLERRNYKQAEHQYALLLKDFGDFDAFAPKLTFTKPHLEAGLKKTRTAAAVLLSRREAEAGRFNQALDVCVTLLRQYPGDAAAEAAYAGARNDLKALGDRAFAGQDYARAGKIYALLLGRAGAFKDAHARVTFTAPELESGVGACRTRLENRGLAAYRGGDLIQALTDWEGLLVFDPGNEEFRKAVQTLRTQIDELRKKQPG